MNPNVEVTGAMMFALASVGLGVTILTLIRVVTWALGTAKPGVHKYDTYECGVPQIGATRSRFSVQFYLVALLFILFDIETVFLLPYAVSIRKLGAAGFMEILIFTAILGLGLLYIIKRRVLEWD